MFLCLWCQSWWCLVSYSCIPHSAKINNGPPIATHTCTCIFLSLHVIWWYSTPKCLWFSFSFYQCSMFVSLYKKNRNNARRIPHIKYFSCKYMNLTRKYLILTIYGYGFQILINYNGRYITIVYVIFVTVMDL